MRPPIARDEALRDEEPEPGAAAPPRGALGAVELAKIRSLLGGGMPMPSSATRTSTRVAAAARRDA